MQKIIIILLFITSGCTSKQRVEKPSIYALKEMSDLATVEYTLTKIIKANDNKTWYKVGDRKILMSCEANIKAGIDMSAITSQNFIINDKNIRLMLPSPKIISLNIPAEKIKVEYEEVSLFRDHYKTQERDQLATQAETQIQNSIDSLGILQQAKINTSLFVNNFLVRLGYENINITYGDAKASILNQ